MSFQVVAISKGKITNFGNLTSRSPLLEERRGQAAE
jgi:hypothetical protein